MALIDILFSEEFLFEGEQADTYRANKQMEKWMKQNSNYNQSKNNSNYLKQVQKQGSYHAQAKYGSLHRGNATDYTADRTKTQSQANKNALKGIEMAQRTIQNRSNNGQSTDASAAIKAAMRHANKHFSLESVELI